MLNKSRRHLTAYVSVRSMGGTNLFTTAEAIDSDTVEEYQSGPDDLRQAAERLSQMGFRVERVGSLSMRISAPEAIFHNQLGLDFERSTTGPTGEETAPDEAVPWTPTPATEMNLMDVGDELIEGIVFPQPIELHQASPPSAHPPNLSYHHLEVPDDIVRGLNAGPVHASGNLGQGVSAAMIDSGFHWSHPYFRSRGYRLKVALQPQSVFQDESGHGTGESANLLAVAPEVELYGLAMDDIIEAFQVARDDLGVKIISNSWGSRWPTDGPNGGWHPYWSLVQAEIALCVQQGILVFFSGGNGGWSFTASMPETISVGGVYADAHGGLQASDYASSFDSTRFPGEHVPEICGLVGMQPSATYIALPIPPGSEIDRRRSGPSFPQKDETDPDDGWGVFSGTSAACPMVAGVGALILSQHPGEALNAVRQRLYRAKDVTQGASSMGDPAGPGFDAATGHGLVDAERACA